MFNVVILLFFCILGLTVASPMNPHRRGARLSNIRTGSYDSNEAVAPGAQSTHAPRSLSQAPEAVTVPSTSRWNPRYRAQLQQDPFLPFQSLGYVDHVGWPQAGSGSTQHQGYTNDLPALPPSYGDPVENDWFPSQQLNDQHYTGGSYLDQGSSFGQLNPMNDQDLRDQQGQFGTSFTSHYQGHGGGSIGSNIASFSESGEASHTLYNNARFNFGVQQQFGTNVTDSMYGTNLGEASSSLAQYPAEDSTYFPGVEAIQREVSQSFPNWAPPAPNESMSSIIRYAPRDPSGHTPILTAGNPYTLKLSYVPEYSSRLNKVFQKLPEEHRVVIMDRLRSVRPFSKQEIRSRLKTSLHPSFAQALVSPDFQLADEAARQYLPDTMVDVGGQAMPVITWMSGLENYDRREVIRRIAECTYQRPDRLQDYFLRQEAGVTLAICQEILRALYVEDIERIVEMYNLKVPAKRGRGVKAKTVHNWQLGLSPIQRDALHQRLEQDAHVTKKSDRYNWLAKPIVPPGYGLKMLKATDRDFIDIVIALSKPSGGRLPLT